jgi:crotonobetaine/carnitine-CoA ligase
MATTTTGPAAHVYTGRDRTAVHVLRDQARRSPDSVLLQADGASYSRAEVHRITNRLACGLRAAGVGEGDPVLLLLGNSAFYILCWLALAKLGAIEVPVNTQYRGQMLAHVVNSSHATTLVLDPEFADNLVELLPELPELKTVIRSPGFANAGHLEPRVATLSAEDLLEAAEAESGFEPAYNQTMALMYTSGTTGRSKGVLVSHAHAYEYAQAVREVLALRSADVYYAPLPLFHIAGQWGVVYAALMSGASAVITPRFSASSFWNDVATHRATTSFLLGALANFLQQQPERADDAENTLERILMSPLVPELTAFKRRFGVQVATAYGSTEANVPLLSDSSITDASQCGRIRPGWSVELVDQDDEVLPAKQPGEIVVRPPEPWLTMRGYLDNPEATARSYRNCWLHTGDLAYRDEDGNFYFLDRISDAIRRRGENISSFEVEREVNAHPNVLESAAIGVASEHTEQELMVFAVPVPGASLTAEELHRFLAERAPRFMVPRYIEIIESLPKTPTDKIRKSALRDRGAANAWEVTRAK